MLEIAVAISRVYPQIQVELIEIDSAKYDDWLFCNNLADSEATRAAFISYDDDE